MPMTTRDIFQRELAGEVISLSDPEYPKIAALITEAQRIIAEMNTGYRDPAEGHAARRTGISGRIEHFGDGVMPAARRRKATLSSSPPGSKPIHAIARPSTRSTKLRTKR